MNKRKIHSSQNGPKKSVRKLTDEATNNFTADGKGADSPLILEEALLVLLKDVESKKRIQREASSGRILSEHDVQSLKFVVERLEKAPNNFDNQGGACSLTGSDMANIILPWTVKHLLFLAAGKDNDLSELELLWDLCSRAFRLSFLNSSDCDASSASSFSTLDTVPHGMIQKLMIFALKSCDLCTNASTTLCLLLSNDGFSQSIEFLCQSVFVVLVEVLTDLTKNESKPLCEELRSTFETIAISSLCSLHRKQESIHSSTSPKKVFRVLASESVLVAIAKLSSLFSWSESVQELIQKNVWRGFFDPSNHIDSFRSMQLKLPDLEQISNNSLDGEKSDVEKKSMKEKLRTPHCYQSVLMASFRSIFDKLLNDENQLDIAAFASLTELLGRGFCVQTAAWQAQKEKSNKKAVASLGTATLQFRFLAGLIGPFLHLLKKAPSSHLFQSFTFCLDLMFEFDSYHPTYEDPNQYHFKFLQKLFEQSLKSLEADCETSECLKAIESMVRLNHLLIHEEIPRLVAHSAMSRKRTENQIELKSLAMTLIKTYQELRQLGYLLNAFVESYKIFRTSVNQDRINTGLDIIHEVFKDNDTVRVISSAVSSAPYGQTQALFKTFDDWIVNEVPMLQSHADSKDVQTLHGFLSVVATLFVSLLRNLRVDEHSSNEVSSLCHHSLLNCVSLLITQTQKDDIKNAFLSQSKNDSKMTERQRRLKQFVKDTLLLFGWILDLQNRCSFWSSSKHLFTELSGDKDIQCLVEKTLDEDNYLILAAPEELQFVALYRIQQLHSLIYETQKEEFSLEVSRKGEFQRQAQRLVNFVFVIVRKTVLCIKDFDDSYDVQKVDLHLSQQSQILLSQFLPAWTTYCRDEHVQVFLSFIFHSIAQCSNDRSLVATALLEDDSFFENNKLHPKFLLVGLENIQKLLKFNTGTETKSGGSFISDSLSHQKLFDEKDCKSIVEKVHLILEALNSAPDGSRVCNDPTKLLDFIREMDLNLCLRVKDKACNFSFETIRAIATGRSLFRKVVMENVSSIAIMEPKKWYKDLMTFILESTKEIMLCDNQNITDQLLASSSDVMEATAFLCFHHYHSSQAIGEIFKEILSTSEFVLDRIESVLFSAFATGVNAVAITKKTDKVFNEFGIDFLNELLSFKEKSLVKDVRSFLLLVGRIWTFCGEDGSENLFNQLVLDHLTQENNFSEMGPKALFHLIGVLLIHHTFDQVPKTLHEHALFKPGNGSIESCIVCNLVLKFDANEYNKFLESLLSKPSFKADSAIIVRLLLTATKVSKVHRLEMSKFGFKILCTAVDSLTTSTCDSLEAVKAVTELLLEMMKHKDVITIKERDIARLLSQVGCSLDSMQNSSSKECIYEVFSSSCALLTSLVQRFPNQLCTCVATTIVILQKLFQFMITRAGSEQEVSPFKAGRDLARLCEMLVEHRDVFKKHINCIIIDFVVTLQNDLEPIWKKVIAPSVYFLLEMLSEHEINHLNALLDPTGRAVFRSFFDGFKKSHIYKGT